MKPLKWFCKYILSPIGIVIGGYMGVEAWVIKTANTVVEPVKKQVEVTAVYDKLLHESIERELIHIRHYQEENNKYLRTIK